MVDVGRGTNCSSCLPGEFQKLSSLYPRPRTVTMAAVWGEEPWLPWLIQSNPELRPSDLVRAVTAEGTCCC